MLRTIEHIKDVVQGKTSITKRRHKDWRSFRKDYLKICNECKICGSKRKLAVHHIVPFHVDPSRELQTSNCMTLCFYCHLIFGHLKNYKSYNRQIQFDAIEWEKRIKERI